MKPAAFKYVCASSLDHALALKAEYGDDAKFLAGGQSLIPTMNFRLARPAVLIDINRITNLAGIQQDDGGLTRIGATTRYRSLENAPAIKAMFPLMREALTHVAHPQIRNRGTLGGNLSHADPASEMPAVCVALGARFLAKSASGERWIDAADFFLGLLTTDLQPDEILVEIELPAPLKCSGSCFMEVARRRGDFAIAGVAALVTLNSNNDCDKIRLVCCGVGEAPVDVSEAAAPVLGHVLSHGVIADIATSAQAMLDPGGSVHGSAEYQRHLAGVLVKRTLATAHQRARDGR